MPRLASASAEEYQSSTKLSFIDISHRHSEDVLLFPSQVQATCARMESWTDHSQEFFNGGLPSPPASEPNEAGALMLDTNDVQCDSNLELLWTPVSEIESRKAIPSFPGLDTPNPEYQTRSMTCPSPTPCTPLRAGKHVKGFDGINFPLEPLPKCVLDMGPKGDRGKHQNSKRRCVSADAKILTPPASPDRYISSRYSPQPQSSTFHASKSPQKLSGMEKLLRQNSASPDPFRSPTRQRGGTRVISGDNDEQESRSPSRSTSGPMVLGLLRSPLTIQQRQASAGAVWSVGGLTAASPTGPIHAVSNGRGGLIGSGTNAPMYTSRFLEGETPDQDLERFEGRLAAALDIDQTRRMLDIPGSPNRGGDASTGSVASKRKYPFINSRTRWEHGEWVQGGTPSCEWEFVYSKISSSFQCPAVFKPLF